MRAILQTMRARALVLGLCLAMPLTAFAQQSAQPMSHDMPGMNHGSMQGMNHGSMQGMDMPGMDHGSMGKPKPKPKAKPPAKVAPTPPPEKGSHEKMDHGSMPGMTMPMDKSAPMPGMKHEGMDHGSMPGMSKPQPSSDGSSGKSEMKGMDHGSMPGMTMPAAPAAGMSGMHHDSGSPAMQGMDHSSMPGMSMGKMQGGDAPPDARSPDYSEGVSAGSMRGMDMLDNAPLGMLLIDQLEAYRGRDGSGQRWEAQGWYGNDSNKLWIRTEGKHTGGKVEDANVEALWYRPFAAYWGSQAGIRQDVGGGPGRTWAAMGVQGLAPYWFDVQFTAYVSSAGRLAARARAEYDLRLTQRLYLQPEGEVNLYSKNDEPRGVGSGLSDMRLGLRLRYEVVRQFAPYIGVNFSRRLGNSADYARQEGHSVFDRQVVAGVRMWF